MANHFTVLRVTFLNTITNDLLLYGEQIRFTCPTLEFSYNSPEAYKMLLRKVPEESFKLKPSPPNHINPQRPDAGAKQVSPPQQASLQATAQAGKTAATMTEAARQIKRSSDRLQKASEKTADASQAILQAGQAMKNTGSRGGFLATKVRRAARDLSEGGGSLAESAELLKEASGELKAVVVPAAEAAANEMNSVAASVTQMQREMYSQTEELKASIAQLQAPPTHAEPLRVWTTRRSSTIHGDVSDGVEARRFTPIPLSFLIRGFDKREFDTTKARVFRSLDFAANIATGLIPFVNSGSYADYAGIYSGLALPKLKTFVGDMTDVQRQAFLQESMPQYLELKVGQSVSKLVYLPRFGADKLKKDRVVFLSEVGNKQDFEIRAAMIKNVENASASE